MNRKEKKGWRNSTVDRAFALFGQLKLNPQKYDPTKTFQELNLFSEPAVTLNIQRSGQKTNKIQTKTKIIILL